MSYNFICTTWLNLKMTLLTKEFMKIVTWNDKQHNQPNKRGCE